MDAIDRHWKILRMIPRRHRMSTTDILIRLESDYGMQTTLRTIQRDMISLSRQFPIVSDETKPAGWCWAKDAPAFDIPGMDPVTALAFSLAEKHITRLLPQSILSALNPYFRTAENRLAHTTESRLSTWPDKVRVVSRSLTFIPPHVPEEISETVHTALMENRWFQATYRILGGRIKTYEVNPLGMAVVDRQTYLIVTLNAHHDPVLLLLHRIQKAELLEKSVVVPDGFDLDAYISKELSFPVGEDIHLTARFSDSHDIQRLDEAPVSMDQKICEQKDGLFVLTATLADKFQLRWWLRGYGDGVEVLAPEALRQEFMEMTQELDNMYGDI